MRRTSKQKKRDLVVKILQAFRVELREIFKRLAPDHYARFPNGARPCHTCAFNPATDEWEGADTTAMTLMKCLRDGSPFYCHEGIPWTKDIKDWTPAELKHYMEHKKLCAGYATVVSDPKAKEAFIVAALTAQGKRPAQAAIDLALSAIEGAGDITR